MDLIQINAMMAEMMIWQRLMLRDGTDFLMKLAGLNCLGEYEGINSKSYIASVFFVETLSKLKVGI